MICGNCEQLCYPLAGKEKEGLFFCGRKGSRVTKKSVCKDVPVGRYFWLIDNPYELEELKKELEV